MTAEFKKGEESDEGDLWSGRLIDATAIANVKIMHTLVMCYRKRELRSIASKVGIRFGAVQLILTDILSMSKVSARWVL